MLICLIFFPEAIDTLLCLQHCNFSVCLVLLKLYSSSITVLRLSSCGDLLFSFSLPTSLLFPFLSPLQQIQPLVLGLIP